MKKIILFTAIATALFTTFESCKKESKSTPPVVIPIESGSVAQLIAGKTILPASNGSWELGVSFKSSVGGNIKSFKVNLPVTGSKLVTLWKSSDQTIIASRTINSSHINTWDDSVAVDIPIEANTEYILSINSDNYFTSDVPAGTFPYIHGSIILLNYKATSGAAQAIPTTEYGTGIWGFVDFTFQKASS